MANSVPAVILVHPSARWADPTIFGGDGPLLSAILFYDLRCPVQWQVPRAPAKVRFEQITSRSAPEETLENTWTRRSGPN